MEDGFACPQCGASHAAFKTMSGAILAMTEEMAVEPILRKIVHAARELACARYAALGVPDGGGGFAQFITSGMTSEQWDAIGPLPRTHGMLSVMLQQTAPYRTADVQQDPRFQGWPDAHPDMRSFLGVPIVSKDKIIGAFYLTDKETGAEFTEADQQLIELLAAHAAVAIENARLYGRSRELTVIEERNRLARDLHDSVAQKLFSAVLTAEAAATLIDRDPQRAKAEVQKLQELTHTSLQELRSLIFELRPAELEADGFVPTLRKHIDVLRRVYQLDIDLRVKGERRLKAAAEKRCCDSSPAACPTKRSPTVWYSREDGEDPRQQHPPEAPPRRPYPGCPLRGEAGLGRPTVAPTLGVAFAPPRGLRTDCDQMPRQDTARAACKGDGYRLCWRRLMVEAKEARDASDDR